MRDRELFLDVLDFECRRLHFSIAGGLRGDGVGELRLQRFVCARSLARLHALERALSHVCGGHFLIERRLLGGGFGFERSNFFGALGLGGFHFRSILQQLVLGFLLALHFVLLVRQGGGFLHQLLGHRVGTNDQVFHL